MTLPLFHLFLNLSKSFMQQTLKISILSVLNKEA